MQQHKCSRMISEKTDIKSLEYKQLEALLQEQGQPRFRGQQVFSWLHRQCVDSFEEMTNLPKALREELEDRYRICKLKKRKVLTSKIDGTRKYLFELSDGIMIESVMMPYEHGNSVCVSTQAGCGMGCSFCASAIGGCVRDLSTSEILGQVYEIQQDIGARVSHVVLMGMGEPLANYENVVRFVRIT